MLDRNTRRGFWLQASNQHACEIARIVGFEIVVFDCEHGVFDVPSLDRLIPFCANIGLLPFVRVHEASQTSIQTALDLGAQGIILPQIRDFLHAQSVAAFTKYPPDGLRGMGYSRTMNYGAADDAYIARENLQRHCYVMIETATAFDERARIASLPSVDGLFVGPSDLSLSRGRGVFQGTQADFDDLEAIAIVAKDASKQFAAAGPSIEYERAVIQLSANFVVSGDELTALSIGFRSLLGI